MKVDNVIMGSQEEKNENLKKIINLINNKKINLKIVKANEIITLENEVNLNILWPQNTLIEKNSINNNSLVFKLNYKDFSILFTGDIEYETEQELVKKYNKNNILNSTILKIAHHGSSSSTSEEFLKDVKPEIALIGVGKNNKFGHPSDEILERLQKINCKIYRTDKNGEIIIEVDKNGKIKIKTIN